MFPRPFRAIASPYNTLFILICICLYTNFVKAATNSSVELKQCKFNSYLGLTCFATEFHPQSILVEKKRYPIAAILTGNLNPVQLEIPYEFTASPELYAEYKSFGVIKSCIETIKPGYFRSISGPKNVLESISFNRVTCLNRLSTASFEGLINVKRLIFRNMPNLSSLDADFFTQFPNLQELVIENTTIDFFPADAIEGLKHLRKLNLNHNRLTSAPYVPQNSTLLDNFQMEQNPFVCNCALRHFISTAKFLTNSYQCFSPEYLRGTRIDLVKNICAISNSDVTSSQMKPVQSKTRNSPDVTEASIRLEIIIPAIILVVAILATLIALVIFKRRKDLSEKKKANKTQTSPSKLDFEQQKPMIQNQIY